MSTRPVFPTFGQLPPSAMIHSAYKGLTSEQVLESRKKNGSNILESRGRNTISILVNVLKEPMMLLLIVASSIYFISGETTEGFIMLSAIALVSGISIYQEIRSENAVKALKKLTQPLTMVVRNGEKISIPSEDLVVGDCMIIAEGEHIAADATVLQSNDCTVNEAILTGESFAVEKGKNDLLLYAGTTVVSGLAHAEVTTVGINTRIGILGKSMEDIDKEKTPLQVQIHVFVKRMAFFGVSAFLIVWLFNYTATGDWLHSLMHGLTLAMAALPEEIPVALSTFMALGAYRMIRNNVLAKHPQTVEALGSATVLCVDKTGTLTENKMVLVEVYDTKTQTVHHLKDPVNSPELSSILEYALFASEPVPFDPMETAIHLAFKEHQPLIHPEDFKMVHEYPLSGTHPMMTHIHEDHKGRKVIACKGAPEGILQNSTLNKSDREFVHTKVMEFAKCGYRVLAVAKSTDEAMAWPKDQDEFTWDVLGLVAFSDPPKKNTGTVIRNFHEAGIEVKMITGDFPVTATSIAAQTGLHHAGDVLTGSEVMAMDEKALCTAVKDISIFARMMPEAKLRVINALKKNGEVVAMTGDGVNDGPALKAAHIGIAMGKRGSEIARQASSLILVNDDLGNMVTAVALGRKIYANLKKAIQYIITIHIPLISIVTLPLLLGWKFPNIFTPVHVIFLELVMGPTCSIVFENEPMEKDAMRQVPRKMSSTFFTWKELSLSVVQGLALTAGLMVLLYYIIGRGDSEAQARTILFCSLVMANILLTMTGRSRQETTFESLKNKNNLVPIIVGITTLLLICSIYIPAVRDLFQFVRIGHYDLLLCVGTAAVSVLWIDLWKVMRR